MKPYHPKRFMDIPWLTRIEIILYPSIQRIITVFKQIPSDFPPVFQKLDINRRSRNYSEKLINFFNFIRTLGISKGQHELEKSKLGIFNIINLCQALTGLIIPVYLVFNNNEITNTMVLAACGPSIVSAATLFLNYKKHHSIALILYFALHPFFTSIIYMNGMDLGLELNFILYGILAVFFIQEVSHMLLSVAFSMINYFMLAVILKKSYQFDLGNETIFLYVAQEVMLITFIFFGLYLIKKENSNYHVGMESKNEELRSVNFEIEKQKLELAEINAMKNRLFSAISHDLKNPMYALYNVFNNIHHQRMPAKNIKAIMPQVMNDFGYTMSLMENLLQWTKSQMRSQALNPVFINISDAIKDVIALVRLQASGKNITIEKSTPETVFVYADKEMINLVIRNLLSNAVKFTPDGGTVYIGVNESPDFVEVYIRDTGAGMSPETISKINTGNFFTTKGTGNESGTGLGLMLCREFLSKNGGRMHIESTEGKGSIFSFTLPVAF